MILCQHMLLQLRCEIVRIKVSFVPKCLLNVRNTHSPPEFLLMKLFIAGVIVGTVGLNGIANLLSVSLKATQNQLHQINQTAESIRLN